MGLKLIPEIRRLAEEIADAAYKFVETRLLLSDSPAMKWSMHVLEKSYDMANTRRQFIECQRLKLVFKVAHRLRPGALLRTRGVIATRTDVSIDNLANRRWTTIPEGEYVMFSDVVFDQNYDVPTLQLLWKDRVVYLHHETKLGRDFTRLSEFFEVIKT